MSVDQTITELSGTLQQLTLLISHLNGQINGITGRVNISLDNFDQAVANIAKDAGSVTYQVGDTVSQVPNSWVFYLLFITLIVVFILLSVILLLNLVTKGFAIVSLMRSRDDSSSERMLISPREEKMSYPPPSFGHTSQTSLRQPAMRPPPTAPSPRHYTINIEQEPRRVGYRKESNETQSTITSQQPAGSTVRPYQRRSEDAGKYHLESGTTFSGRSMEV